MSRAPINAVVSELERHMDVLTIDPNCLRIPYKNKKNASPIMHYPMISLTTEHHNYQQQAISGDISIEIRRMEPATITEPTTEQGLIISVPGWSVFTGYFFFSLSLALCNLFLNTSAMSPVCIIASPVAMLSFLAHALSVQPIFLSVGLFGSAWLLPFMCALWSTSLSLYYIAFVGVSLGLAYFRLSALVFIVPLVTCLFLSSSMMVVYHGVESHWGISVSVFLVTLLGVFSSRHLARITFKIKPLL